MGLGLRNGGKTISLPYNHTKPLDEIQTLNLKAKVHVQQEALNLQYIKLNITMLIDIVKYHNANLYSKFL